MKSVLCLGDSNTWGVNPEGGGRFEWNERWTGHLQSLLGDDYHIIEEGYCGRTTCFSDASDQFRSAISLLEPVLKTHMPLDLAIIMLGTNDFKTQFSMTAKVSGYGMKKIIDRIRRYCRGENKVCPEILIVSPIMMGKGIADSRFWEFDDESECELKRLPSVLRTVAEMTGCGFFDASTVAVPGPDKLHMTGESHFCLASSLAPLVRNMLG